MSVSNQYKDTFGAPHTETSIRDAMNQLDQRTRMTKKMVSQNISVDQCSLQYSNND